MKKRLSILGLVVIAFFAGCSASTPTAAAQKFFAAIEKNDTKALGEVATPETVELIAAFGEKLPNALAEYGKATFGPETIDGDTAVVPVTFANGEGDNLDLVKVDGKWKVSISFK
jgi:hypothetical protein